VNPNTVMRAYNYLNDENLIQNQRGIGYFIAPSAQEKARNILIKEFFKTQLPEVIQTMKILGIKRKEVNRKMKDELGDSM
ncbi:MAG TPA: hypothetical protein PKD85_17025, partial [Saprospiraceae bacterium]|nr:hypothetical protein [Saprospiraceae bacterium]